MSLNDKDDIFDDVIHLERTAYESGIMRAEFETMEYSASAQSGFETG